MSKVLTDNDDKLAFARDLTVYALDGSDVVVSSLSGLSHLYGGEGRDVLLFQGSDAFGYLYGGGGGDTLSGATQGDALYGEDGSDLMVGGAIDMARFQADGAITIALNQATGDDVLHGDDGRDALYGFDGADILYGGEGDDSGTIGALDATRVDHLVNAGLFGGDGSDFLDGGAGDDLLDGGRDNDRLIGGEGNDRLDGGAGVDRMSGGAGNDIYLVDQAGDGVVEAAGDGIDLVRSSVSYRLGDSVENLTLTGSAKITAIGNASNNVIVGNAGDNVLAGGLGADTLSGASGKDSFFFSAALGRGNVDHVTAFSIKDDTIRLEDSVFKALKPGNLKDGEFKDITSASTKLDGTDHILYNHTTGALYYDPDGSGSQRATLFAILDNHPVQLTHLDFFVV